ncbi:hypothetical protein [Pseudomonas typographi]|uniref:hypothetical protein n=1 Tax=Pseudomonas typographi TaxID=2715964 RepID=UPI001EEE7967|nr:hypothetical protein [Pseudomonas typographi]
MLDYIRLCFECSLDRTTLGNMRGMVIPSLQKEAESLRAAIAMVPPVWSCRQELTADAELLERAVRSGLARCQPLPEQQELFAA